MLTFGPSEKIVGCRFHKDPLIDEDEVTVGKYSFLGWLQRFPHWHLTASLMPDTPPAPGVAIKKAAASAENMDPDQAVAEAYKTVREPSLNNPRVCCAAVLSFVQPSR